MAASLISGLVADDYNPKYITVSDPDGEKLAQLAASYGIRTINDNCEAVRQASVLILAVKPQSLHEVVNGLRKVVENHKPLIISIAAGVREKTLLKWFGSNIPLVRTMPNTPAMIQSGATVLHAAAGVSDQQKDLAENILRAVGLTRWVDDECMMDAVTALSGSGPAYFFLVMEAMENAATKLGLSPENARILTLQTALGASRMAIESRDGPAELRRRVTSPGGTTEQAIKTLEEGGLHELFEKALSDACNRSIELSNLIGKS